MPCHATLLIALALLVRTTPALAVRVSRAEMRQAREWAARHLAGAEDAPFSFTFGGRPSINLLHSWKTTRTVHRLDASRTQTVLTLTDCATRLQITCAAVAYRGYPAVEWTLLLKNKGPADTPVLSDIRPLDMYLM